MNAAAEQGHQVIAKPWGQEEVLEINDRYLVKKLTMHKGHRCSLQYHRIKKETIYVLSGQLKIIAGLSEATLTEKVYRAHEHVTIAPNWIHRMEAVEDSVYLESSTPEMEDVVRVSDDYQRTAP